MLSSQEMDTVTRVQNLDATVCISHSAKNFAGGMYPIIQLPIMDKYSLSNFGPTGLFNINMATGLEGKLEIHCSQVHSEAK